MRCGAVRILVFENPMLRFGAVLSKGKSYGAMWFGRKHYQPQRTVAKYLILKILRPDRGSVRICFFRVVRCDATRIFSLGNPTVRFGATLLKAKSHGAVRFGKTPLNCIAPSGKTAP